MIVKQKKPGPSYTVPVTTESRAVSSSTPTPPTSPSGRYMWSSKPGFQPDEVEHAKRYADGYVSTSEKLFAPKLPDGFNFFKGDLDVNARPKVLDMKPNTLSVNVVENVLDKNSPKNKRMREMLGLR